MVKVSITLPNSAQITFESEEPEVIHEIVGMVLRDLPRELMQVAVQINTNAEGDYFGPAENGAGARHSGDGASPGRSPEAREGVSQTPPGDTAATSTGSPARARVASEKGRGARTGLTDTEQEFVRFCREVNPLGDMRRVVVAAEGADRYLGAESVDSEELGRLFDLVGWQRPHSFVQTLRNAARSKFRWLERVPGRSGHYSVTELGRSTAFGS